MAQPEPKRSSVTRRFSPEGFQPLNRGDAAINIPLQQVNPPQTTFRRESSLNEKAGLFQRAGAGGLRRSIQPGGPTRAVRPTPGRRVGPVEEEDTLTKMGIVYDKFFKASTATRYLLYILPLGILLAIPIILGTTVSKRATIGNKYNPEGNGGIRIAWFFTWLMCAWIGLWVSKLTCHYLPAIFRFFCGVVSPGVRKYSLVISALEIPLSLIGWAVVSLATFKPLMTQTPGHPRIVPYWISVITRLLAATTISTVIFAVQRFFIQLISINYHRRQFSYRITSSKHNIYLLSLLYDASRAMFPAYCPEFADEDAIINDSIDLSLADSKSKNHKKSGSSTPLRFIRGAGRFGDKLTSAFGNIAQEVSGKDVFNPDSAHSIVVEALEKNQSAEALARRIWLSFVVEGNDALYMDDVVEVLGAGRQPEAEECFTSLDRDGNGDVSLDEMVLTVTEHGRERHAIANSMHDVDQAIKALDRLLGVGVFIAAVLIFVSFLVTSFYTTLATTGTALLSLSFVFASSVQEVLGSCIFLFVKHPYDIGDRVEITSTKDQLTVEHISLLYTVFRRVTTNQLVQTPNIVLNSLWIENTSRSNAMREQIPIFVDFKTSFEDIQLLKSEMTKFVSDSQNVRDYFPDVDIQVMGLAEMNRLELQVEILHKSNWANEAVRASRRSRFLCALTLALRRVPINGPDGGGALLGEAANPTYSVAISDATAAHYKSNAADEMEAARLVPSKRPETNPDDKNPQSSEKRAVDVLNDRSPAVDNTRDDPWTARDPSRNHGDSAELEEVKGMLRRESTRGRRKSGRRPSIPSMHSSIQRSPSTKSAKSFRGQPGQAGAEVIRPPIPHPLAVHPASRPESPFTQKPADGSTPTLPQLQPSNYQLPQHSRWV